MSTLLALITLAALIALVVGLFKPGLFASIPWWKKANKIPTRKDTSLLFGGIFIASVILGGIISDGTNGTSEKPVDAIPVKIGTPDQVAFHSFLKAFTERYSQAEGEMGKSKVYREYVGEITKQIPGGAFKDWEGTISRISTNEGGTLVELSIRCNHNDYQVTVQTNNNRLSDMGENTLIRLNTPLFNMIESLKKGDRVKFSGTLIPDPKRGFKVIAITEAGVLSDQVFIARFSAITKL